MSVLVNPAYDPAAVPPPSTDARAFHAALPGYAPTPLLELERGVWLKDESLRLGLPAFKILGASWAVERALASDSALTTFVAASAGNHGRAVAHEARRRGRRARIFLPARALPARCRAIAEEGAEVVMVDGDYEDAVAAASAEAARPGCFELADVGPSGPAAWVIDGYATLFDELPQDLAAILVPAGVGSLAAAAARHGARFGVEVWAVEPTAAACVTASLAAGTPTAVATPGTSMAGMDCAEVSAAAWPSLLHGLRGTITVEDAQSGTAMQALAARGLAIGECGAATLAALPSLEARPVTLIATEGRTAW